MYDPESGLAHAVDCADGDSCAHAVFSSCATGTYPIDDGMVASCDSYLVTI